MTILNNDILKASIIRCGAIGRKRALALDEKSRLVASCDTNCDASDNLAQSFSCEPFSDYRELLHSADCNIVIISVVNKYTKELVIESLKMGKHVLAEKPLGRNAAEAQEIVNALREAQMSDNGYQISDNKAKETLHLPSTICHQARSAQDRFQPLFTPRYLESQGVD